MLITDKGILGKKSRFSPQKEGKKQSKTNRRAVGLGTFLCGVYTIVYKIFVFH